MRTQNEILLGCLPCQIIIISCEISLVRQVDKLNFLNLIMLLWGLERWPSFPSVGLVFFRESKLVEIRWHPTCFFCISTDLFTFVSVPCFIRSILSWSWAPQICQTASSQWGACLSEYDYLLSDTLVLYLNYFKNSNAFY